MISELEFARTIEDLKLAQLEESTENEITKLKVTLNGEVFFDYNNYKKGEEE